MIRLLIRNYEKYSIIYADPSRKYKENWGNGSNEHTYHGENRNYTWYEVLRDTCGIKEPVEAIKDLCDIHQQIIHEQFEEQYKKKIGWV